MTIVYTWKVSALVARETVVFPDTAARDGVRLVDASIFQSSSSTNFNHLSCHETHPALDAGERCTPWPVHVCL